MKVGFTCINAFLCWNFICIVHIGKKSDIRNQQSTVYRRKISLSLSENYEVKTERLEVSESGEDAKL